MYKRCDLRVVTNIKKYEMGHMRAGKLSRGQPATKPSSQWPEFDLSRSPLDCCPRYVILRCFGGSRTTGFSRVIGHAFWRRTQSEDTSVRVNNHNWRLTLELRVVRLSAKMLRGKAIIFILDVDFSELEQPSPATRRCRKRKETSYARYKIFKELIAP